MTRISLSTISAVLILQFIFFLPLAYAHQPRIVESSDTIIEDPEISKAYYGVLDGESEFYYIDSEDAFNLYVNILVPDIENVRKNVYAEISRGEELIFTIGGPDANWEEFYEPFAGDNYWNGGEYSKLVEGGNYTIRVFNDDNIGKYSLAVGQIESFPPSEILNTIKSLPELKNSFFEKSIFSSFNNLIGLFLAGLLIILGIVLWITRRVIRRN